MSEVHFKSNNEREENLIERITAGRVDKSFPTSKSSYHVKI